MVKKICTLCTLSIVLLATGCGTPKSAKPSVVSTASVTASTEKLTDVKVTKNETLEESVDLNGDGTIDKISAVFMSDEKTSDNSVTSCALSINNKVLKIQGMSIIPQINLCDINIKDTFKEIAMVDITANDMMITRFYTYHDDEIFSLGTVDGSFKNANTPGNGIIELTTKGYPFSMFDLTLSYELTKEGKIMEKKEIHTTNYPLVMKEALKLQKSQTDTTSTIILNKDEKVTITGTDNQGWCRVKNSKDEEGWFEVQKDLVKGPEKGVFDMFDTLIPH